MEGEAAAGVVACRRARPRGRGRECGERKAVARLANESSTLSTDSHGLERLLLLPLLMLGVIIIVSFGGGAAAAGAWREEGEMLR